MYNVILRRVRESCCRGKAVSITHSRARARSRAQARWRVHARACM